MSQIFNLIKSIFNRRRAFALALIVAALVLAACGGTDEPPSAENLRATADAMDAAVETVVEQPECGPAPVTNPGQTATCANGQWVVTTGSLPSNPMVNSPTDQSVNTGPCLHGEVLWADSTNYAGYGPSPVGGLEESRWIVGETWKADPQTGAVLESYVWVQPPNSVAWLSGHSGGTAWGLCVNSQQAATEIALDPDNGNVHNVTVRDGIEPTFVVLPADSSAFGLLYRYQTTGTDVTMSNNTTAPTYASTTAAAPAIRSTAAPAMSAAGKCNASDAEGPAILEYGDPSGTATVLKLNTGENSSRFDGGCYAFDSQSALDARWPTHQNEFLGNHPGGVAIEK